MRMPLFVLLLLTMMVSTPALAGECESSRDVVIRDTQSRYAVDGDRYRPLTSTFLSTTSTRLVDARRGFRSYDTVHAPGRYRTRRIHRRSFGLNTQQRYSSPCRRRPVRAGVTTYRGSANAQTQRETMTTPVVYMNDRRDRAAQAAQREEPVEMEVTTYEGEPIMPEHSGAVIVRSDGTVISIGE